MKITYDQMKEAIVHTNNMGLDMKYALLGLIDKEQERNASSLHIEEGHIVKAEGPNSDRRLLLVVKILEEVNEDFHLYGDTIVVVYDFFAKEIDWRGLNLLTNPAFCEIVGKIDPKQIFREDIKI